jgi:hypothetical protein
VLLIDFFNRDSHAVDESSILMMLLLLLLMLLKLMLLLLMLLKLMLILSVPMHRHQRNARKEKVDVVLVNKLPAERAPRAAQSLRTCYSLRYSRQKHQVAAGRLKSTYTPPPRGTAY